MAGGVKEAHGSAEVIFLWKMPSARSPAGVALKVKFDGEGWVLKATAHSYLLL